MPRLVITKGPGTGRDHAVGTECVIGRSTDADFVVEDAGVSRRHCRVLAADGGYAVEDLGSRNGTFVNGTRVGQRQSLADGAVLRVGATEMVFRQKSIVEAPAGPAAAVVPPPIPKPAAVPRTPTPSPDRPAYEVRPRRRRSGW